MAHIPLAPQASLFEPQDIEAPLGQFRAQTAAVNARTQTFNSLNNFVQGVAREGIKINNEQIQADKVVGSNQIQNTIRNLQADAIKRFPGQDAKQQAFFNQTSQSFLTTFIPAAHSENRAFFKAVGSNLLSEANFKYTKNIVAQNLKTQKVIIANNFNDSLVLTVKAIHAANPKLARSNMGHGMAAITNAVKNGSLTPAEGAAYGKKFHFAANLAGAETHISAALALGGIPAAEKKMSEQINDPTNPHLADPKEASSWISKVRSFTSGITAGARASASANKDKIKDINNNIRLTGNIPVQKVAQFGMEASAQTNKVIHDRTFAIWSEPPLQRQKDIAALDLNTVVGVGIKNTLVNFSSAYKKDKMTWMQNQLAQEQFGEPFANSTPVQQQQIRNMGVEAQINRGDVNIEPATNADMQTVLAGAKSGVDDFASTYSNYLNKMGKNKQAGVVQLSKFLSKNGIDSSIESIDRLANKNGDVAQGIRAAALQPIAPAKLSIETKTGLTPTQLNDKLKTISAAAINQDNFFSMSANTKYTSSLVNGAGNFAGAILGNRQENMERYMIISFSNGKSSSLENAAQKYNDEFDKSFNYSIQRNGAYIRIPLQYHDRPLDKNRVVNTLRSIQGAISQNDIDLSQVQQSVHTSQEVARDRYWAQSGSYNSWVTAPDGESYVLIDSQGKTLNWKKTKLPIRMRISDVVKNVLGISEVVFAAKQPAPSLLPTAAQQRRSNLEAIQAVGAPF